MPDTNMGWDQIPEPTVFDPPASMPQQQDRSFTDRALNIPEPWTQSDDVELQQLNNGAAVARQKGAAGIWDQDTTTDILGQINDRRLPLLERQQQTQQAMQKIAQQQMMQQAAQVQAVNQANGQHAAQVFPNTLYRDFDPVTGQQTTYYQKEPGKWDVGSTSEPQLAAEAPTASGSPGGTAEGAGQGTGEGGQLPETLKAIAADAYKDAAFYAGFGLVGGGPDYITAKAKYLSAWDAYQKAQGTNEPAPPIVPGGQGEGGAVEMRGNQLSGTRQAGPTRLPAELGGAVPPPPSPEEARFAPPAALRAAWQRGAAAAVSGMAPGPHQQHAYGQIIARHEADWMTAQQHKADQDARTAAADAKSKADMTTKQRADVYQKEIDRLTREIHDHRLHTKDPAEVPDELTGPTGKYLTPTEIRDQAGRNADEIMRHAYRQPGAEPQPASTGGQAAPSAAAPATPRPGPALIEQQSGKLDAVEQTMAQWPAGPTRDAAGAALKELRQLVTDHHGDITRAPKDVQERAAQLALTIKVASPAPTKEERGRRVLELSQQGFGM